MPDNTAGGSAVCEKCKHEAHTANTLRSFANEIRLINEQYAHDPATAHQKTAEALSHYKI